MLFAVSIGVFALVARLGFLQIVRGEELKKQALEQWTKGIPIQPRRGIIYDRNGKKLAMSVARDTVWCNPANIVNPEETARVLAEILDLDEQDTYQKITRRQSLVKIKQWIEKEESEKLREARLRGIEIVGDNKRFYPYGSFASFILGHTDIDQVGQYGIERSVNKYLTGTPGRYVQTVDAVGRQLPYGQERLYEAKDGLNVVLTIDETIQHFAEKIALETYVKNKAKTVSILVMQPKTGDILAMATMPDYDPNDPRTPLDDNLKREWEGLSQQDLLKNWYAMWRNYPIHDSYEPGSTFKILTGAAGLEENIITPNSQFYCDGFIRHVKHTKPIKCWRYYNPHGQQNLAEGFQNSCNEVFVDIGMKLGAETMVKYIKAFGFGETTGINLAGETTGIVNTNPATIRDINLATISFGQGIAVTPIQLVTAISAIANGGNLMVPRLVKELINEDGEVIHTFDPEVKRKVLSEQTSKTTLEILESVVSDGTGRNSYVEGYRVGGKTGTAQKVVDGRYAPGKYIASFVAVAPSDDPEVVVLVIIDEPSNGAYYGGQIAAPVAGEIIRETLTYLDIEPQYTEAELKAREERVITVPDVRQKNIKEASRNILSLGLKYSTDIYDIEADQIVIDQFPLPGTRVNKGSVVDIYIQEKRNQDNRIVVPDLTGKSMKNTRNLLDELGLNYRFKGEGIVVSQTPKAGTQVKPGTTIEVEFKYIND